MVNYPGKINILRWLPPHLTGIRSGAITGSLPSGDSVRGASESECSEGWETSLYVIRSPLSIYPAERALPTEGEWGDG